MLGMILVRITHDDGTGFGAFSIVVNERALYPAPFLVRVANDGSAWAVQAAILSCQFA